MALVIFPPKEELADDESASTPSYTLAGGNTAHNNSIYSYPNVALNHSATSITSTTGLTWTAGTGLNSPWANTASPWLGNGITSDSNDAGRLTLNGDRADVEINGKSLLKTLQALEERLNILVPNPELEAEWEELKVLGDQYRALEAKLKEQGEMWAKLKAMPPPEVK